MGNFNSSINLKTATLLEPNGNTHKIQLPTTAADLMLEHLGHIISPADIICRTGKISAIKAENCLLPEKLYLLVPTSRVHSKATSSETALIAALKKRRGYRRCSSKVSPVALTARESGLTCQRQRVGVWKPVLEPIFEEPRGYVKYLTRVLR